jgi:hypothetical protein
VLCDGPCGCVTLYKPGPQPVLRTGAAQYRRTICRMNAGIGQTVFKTYSDKAFVETSSWHEMQAILSTDGGAYGIYGPRGSGKSWLMRRAADEAVGTGGMGLWFPCPSGDDSAAILSSLSDNLASEVERRFRRDNPWRRVMRWLRYVLTVVVAVPVVVAVVTYAAHGLGSKLQPGTLYDTLPVQLWYTVGAAIVALCALAVVSAVRADRPSGRLARESTALRERIRYTTALKYATEADVTAGSKIAGTLRQSREKSLDERPTTVASLVFDFRRLASLIVEATGQRLVIGVDELDKIDDPETAYALLRDIKGIFEISGVFFLVSVSEEAATALQLGPLQGKGRNEFNSSFYTVIELPPLGPDKVGEIAKSRGVRLNGSGEQLLCLLSAGNWRELIRLVDGWPPPLDQDESEPGRSAQLRIDQVRACRILAREAAALQREIVRAYSSAAASDTPEAAFAAGAAKEILPRAWAALPEEAFGSVEVLDALGQSVIQQNWDLGVGEPTWEKYIAQSWRRFIIRLFVIGRVMTGMGAYPAGEYDETKIYALRAVLIMAGHSAPVAQLMLKARFGESLAGSYALPLDRP